MTVETFKSIFEKLKLGTIETADEDIFKEVADFDKDGVINLEDFRQILNYKPGQNDEENQSGNDNEGDQDNENEDEDSMGEDDEAHNM